MNEIIVNRVSGLVISVGTTEVLKPRSKSELEKRIGEYETIFAATCGKIGGACESDAGYGQV